MAGNRAMFAVLAAVIAVSAAGSGLAYYYYGQLSGANAVIQGTFVKRAFNYTIVFNETVPVCNCSNYDLCVCAMSFPVLQNITLVPLGNATPVANAFDLGALPSEPLNSISPTVPGYEFSNGAYNETSVGLDDGGTAIYHIYTGQVVMIYSKGAPNAVFNLISQADPPLVWASVVVELPP